MYTLKEIEKTINQLKVYKDDTIYVSGNLINIGLSSKVNFLELPKIIFNQLFKKIGPNGTIVVPSHTFFLTKDRGVFDLKNTSSESGSLSNYIIKKKNTIRQIHPYSSCSAIGTKAKYICSNNTKHAYGPDSPFERMIKLNTKFISIGLPINENCSQVHHAEFNMGVPYRYTKEFSQKIKIGKKIKHESFYLFVLYEQFIKKKRNKNKIILKNFLKTSKIIKKRFGKSYIYQYSMKDFYLKTLNLMKKDIFCWMGSKPKKSLIFKK
jgi:aminoglycoside 3-N-acetyltransferase